jgi:signal transduction histidine kinase
MINKLRKKIFWIIQLSLTTIIIGIIVIFAGFSYRNTIVNSTSFMERVEEFKTVRINDVMNNNNSNNNAPRMEIDPFNVDFEGVYKFEYNNNKVIKVSDNVTDEIKEYANKLVNSNQEEGFIGNYIYRIRKVGNGKEIVLMENEEAINRLKISLISAIGIGLLAIFGIYLIAKKISKTIVKPVEESFEKQKQFISDASHELKTPLAVIEANADVLQSKEKENNKWITYIQNEVQSMNKLVNDLLTLSRMENTNSSNIQKFDLSKEVEMSVAVFESMIYEKEIKLKTNIEKDIMFNGDKDDIKHLVSIILDNAIKHTNNKKKIIVNTLKEKNSVKIEIKNQGEPIPEEEREKIFERFYRVDKSRNRSEKRYGLGLAIAKGIVDKYNGTISASSENGFTSFNIKLNNK